MFEEHERLIESKDLEIESLSFQVDELEYDMIYKDEEVRIMKWQLESWTAELRHTEAILK